MLFVVLGQLLTLDMSLTFYMTCALGAFLLAQSAAARRVHLGADLNRGGGVELGWMTIAWAATALGVLTKGPVAAAIPAAVLVLYSLWSRDLTPWRRLHVRWGLPLFLAITVPWHWLAARRLPDFLQFFFVHEHLSRYLTPSADREEAWWFFAVVFVLGSAPWTLSALRVVALGWRGTAYEVRRATARYSSPVPRARGQFDPSLFLWLWVMFVCVFFSLSDSKLIPYILPAMPALALLIGASPSSALRRDVLATALLTIAAGVALGVVGAFGPRFIASTSRNQYFLLLAKPLVEIAALLILSGIFVVLQRSRDLTRAAVFLGVGWCLAGMLLMQAAGAVAPIYSGVVLARALGSVPGDVPIYSVGTYDQSLPFYWRRTVRLVAYRGELDFGLRQDPAAELPEVLDFVGQWQNLPDGGYAVMEIRMFDDLTGRGVPLREVARDVHRVLAARR